MFYCDLWNLDPTKFHPDNLWNLDPTKFHPEIQNRLHYFACFELMYACMHACKYVRVRSIMARKRGLLRRKRRRKRLPRAICLRESQVDECQNFGCDQRGRFLCRDCKIAYCRSCCAPSLFIIACMRACMHHRTYIESCLKGVECGWALSARDRPRLHRFVDGHLELDIHPFKISLRSRA